MQRFINKLILNPKKLFLLDGFGALLTTFFLFGILRTFNEFFGMPKMTLKMLSIIALVFCTFSFCCLLIVKKNWQPFLLIIIIANLLYTLLTLGLVIFNYPKLTTLGVFYFLLEIVIICGLVFLEINALIISVRRRRTDLQT